MVNPSFSRISFMKSVPQASFLATGDLRSIIRQNGVIWDILLPFISSSHEFSATMRRNIPAVTGHVYSAWYSAARSSLICFNGTCVPSGILRTYSFTIAGVAIRKLCPAGISAKSLSLVFTSCSRSGLIFSDHVFLVAMAIF